MKTWLSVALLVGLLSTALMPMAGAKVVKRVCVPGAPNVKTYYPAVINLGPGKSLIGKFFYPKPGPSADFNPRSLPGVIMTHGFGQTYANVEAQASELARNCMVVLIYNYFGHGWDWEISTRFDMYSTAERDGLTAIVEELKAGPIKNTLDLVDDARLGVMGYSQGGTYAWLALADPNQRAKFLAAAVSDEVTFPSAVLMPNGCLNADLANFIDPRRARTPIWTPGNPTPTGTFPARTPGAVWEPTTYKALYDAYLTPNAPTWEAALAARDFPVTQLAQTGTPGMPHPHTYIQASWYDVYQLADDAITPWATLTTGTPFPSPTPPATATRSRAKATKTPIPTATSLATPTPPSQFHQLRIGPGGHSDGPWEGDLNQRVAIPRLKIGRLRSQLEVTPLATATPSRTPTGVVAATATRTPTPYPVEYVVDTYITPATPFGTVVFDMRQSSVWPPPEVLSATPWTFYLHTDGSAKTVTPAPGDSQAVSVAQTLATDSGYDLGAAVAQSPKFKTWAMAIAVQPQEFVSAVLDQDVTLYGPPTVQLFTDASPGGGLGQLHVRILELDPATGHKMFVTRANACNWSTTDMRAEFLGSPFTGEPRFHTFKAGRQIVVEVTTVDTEIYRPSRNLVYITPYLASFSLGLRVGQAGQNTNVTLPLLASDPGAPLFRADGSGTAPLVRQSAAVSSEPLRLEAVILPDFTNPGGWRAWASEVWFECRGGVAPVDCPEDQLLWGDGAGLSFTYEARDAAGNVATVTLGGLNIDRTPPDLRANLPARQTFCSQATLPLGFGVSDGLSGLAEDQATFNGRPVVNGQRVPLAAGPNTLTVTAEDVAGNGMAQSTSVQVDYAATLALPEDGQVIEAGRPLHFGFAIADACSANGRYGQAVGRLWFTGPDGVERPAAAAGRVSGNAFTYDDVTGWYAFEADVSGLAAGAWTARVHLDDGNDYTTTFVVP